VKNWNLRNKRMVTHQDCSTMCLCLYNNDLKELSSTQECHLPMYFIYIVYCVIFLPSCCNNFKEWLETKLLNDLFKFHQRNWICFIHANQDQCSDNRLNHPLFIKCREAWVARRTRDYACMLVLMVHQDMDKWMKI